MDLYVTGPAAERAPGDLAALLYTSGTTGRSKGAMLTHDNLLSNALALEQVWAFRRNDVLLHALPIFHTHGLFVATNATLAAGGSMIFMPRFDLNTLISQMPHTSVMPGVPTFYTRLLKAPGFDREAARNVRLFISGSARLLVETHRAFEARTGHCILERYGMTETNVNTSNPIDGERREGTLGLPLPGVEVRITQPETGMPLPDGDVGGIEVRGPNVFTGYWNMPEKTAEDLRPDEQPGVLESAVVGVPDADFGEAVIAYVVPLPGATLEIDDLRKTCQAHMARFKHPRAFHLVKDLPRNTMGKVQKVLLRQSHAQIEAPSVATE